MKKLVLGAMFGLLAACGGGDESPDARIIVRDDGGGGGIDAGNPGACNILTQTGCDAGEKCAWVRVQVSAATQLGQLACVPNGTVAVDGQCAVRRPGRDHRLRQLRGRPGLPRQLGDRHGDRHLPHHL